MEPDDILIQPPPPSGPLDGGYLYEEYQNATMGAGTTITIPGDPLRELIAFYSTTGGSTMRGQPRLSGANASWWVNPGNLTVAAEYRYSTHGGAVRDQWTVSTTAGGSICIYTVTRRAKS